MIGPRLVLTAALAALPTACAAAPPIEFVNITFVPSIDTSHYESWRFDLEACRDFEDARVDDARLRAHLLRAIREELEGMGHVYREEGEVEFLVHYELWLADSGGSEAIAERARGRILIQDVATGRFVWRGERKASVSRIHSEEELDAKVRYFADEVLQHARSPFSAR